MKKNEKKINLDELEQGFKDLIKSCYRADLQIKESCETLNADVEIRSIIDELEPSYEKINQISKQMSLLIEARTTLQEMGMHICFLKETIIKDREEGQVEFSELVLQLNDHIKKIKKEEIKNIN